MICQSYFTSSQIDRLTLIRFSEISKEQSVVCTPVYVWRKHEINLQNTHDTMVPGSVMDMSTTALMTCFHTHFINAWILSKQQYTE